MHSTKFDGASLEAFACKPDAKSVESLLDFLPQFLSVTVLMFAASQAEMMGTMSWETCLVMVGLQASYFSLLVKGVSMLLEDCFVSLVWLFVMNLLSGCGALWAPDLVRSLMMFSPIFARPAFLLVQVASMFLLVPEASLSLLDSYAAPMAPGLVCNLMALLGCACSLLLMVKVSSMFPPGQDASLSFQVVCAFLLLEWSVFQCSLIAASGGCSAGWVRAKSGKKAVSKSLFALAKDDGLFLQVWPVAGSAAAMLRCPCS